jgi:hypothetical protein
MAALAGAAVVVTLCVLAVPTYGIVRAALARAQGERFIAIARSAESALPDDFAPTLGGATDVTLPQAVRDLVRRIRISSAQQLGDGSELLGVDILVRTANGRFRYLLHGDRNA